VVVLQSHEQNKWPSRLLITDLLPAGFEIDIPAWFPAPNCRTSPGWHRTDAAHSRIPRRPFRAAFNTE